MINIVNLVIYIGVSLIVLVLLFDNVRQRIKKIKFKKLSTKLGLEKIQALKELNIAISNKQLEQSEGFVNFLTESRDWAFTYIQEVQEALKEFDNTVVPILEYQKTYGKVLGTNTHSNNIDEISLAYDKLKSVLPKENITPNN
jgi:hypothetical protein